MQTLTNSPDVCALLNSFHDYTTDNQSDPFHPKILWTPPTDKDDALNAYSTVLTWPIHHSEPLSSAEASLYCGEAFVLWGGWGERKRERAGHRPPRAFYFCRLLIFWWGYPAGASAEERDSEPRHIRDNLLKAQRRALRLKQRHDIVIKSADKGSATVIMDRKWYLDECDRQLNNPTFYEQQDTDLSDTIQKRLTEYVKRMLNDELIDKKKNISTLNVHELFWMLQCNFNASV